jgi:hypothetical protein
MRRFEIYIVVSLVVLIIMFFAFQYIFMIYEVTYDVSPKKLFADNSSTITISTSPVNAFGWTPPFRTSSAVYEIQEGADLVEIIEQDVEKGFIRLRAKDKTGKVVIHAKSKNALLPTPVEIIIEPNAV